MNMLGRLSDPLAVGQLKGSFSRIPKPSHVMGENREWFNKKKRFGVGERSERGWKDRGQVRKIQKKPSFI